MIMFMFVEPAAIQARQPEYPRACPVREPTPPKNLDGPTIGHVISSSRPDATNSMSTACKEPRAKVIAIIRDNVVPTLV